MKKFIALFLALAMIFAFCACGNQASSTPAANDPPATNDAPATSGEPEEPTSTDTYTFTYATVDAEGSDHDRLVESKLKELLEEKSGGRMTLEVYYSGSMAGVGSTMDAIKNGTIDMGYDACGFYGGMFPYTELFSVPCLYFGDSEEATAVLREFDELYTDELLNDYKIMARFVGEEMCFYTKGDTPIKTPADIQGMTFRTTGSNKALIEACGGVGQGMPTAEVFEALRLNVVDGSVSNFGSIITFNFAEVTNCLTIVPILNSEGTVFMSKELYESMNDVDKAIIDEVCAEFQQCFMDYNAWNHDNVVEYLEANFPDFQVYEMTDEEIAAFVALGEANLEAKAAELDALGLDGTGAMNWLKDHAK